MEGVELSGSRSAAGPVRRRRSAHALRLVVAVSGGASALTAWLALLPWDLSEVDERGRTLPSGGDRNAPAIAMVLVMVIVGGVVLSLLIARRGVGSSFTAGGCVVWAVLFGWRAGTSRTSGANMFAIPLLFAVVPAAILVPAVMSVVDRGAARRRDRRAPPNRLADTRPSDR